MYTVPLILMILLALVFLVWTVVIFRVLFRLKDIADHKRQKAGRGMIAGYADTLTTFREFATSAMHRRDRRRLIWLTVMIFAIIVLQAVVLART